MENLTAARKENVQLPVLRKQFALLASGQMFVVGPHSLQGFRILTLTLFFFFSVPRGFHVNSEISVSNNEI